MGNEHRWKPERPEGREPAPTAQSRPPVIDVATRRLLGGASFAFVLKIAGAGGAFLVTLVLARILGAAEVGIFHLGFTLAVVGSALGTAGMDQTLVRWVAGHASRSRWGSVRGGVARAQIISLILAGSLALVLTAAASWLARDVFAEPSLRALLYWLAPALVLMSAYTVRAAALQGLRQIGDSVMTVSVLLPLTVILLAPWWVKDHGTQGAAAAYLAGALVALCYGVARWHLSLRRKPGPLQPVAAHALLRSGLHFLSISALNLCVSWAGVLALGFWHESTQVGLYSTAYRTAALISFVLVAVNTISAPTFAALHEHGDVDGLERLARATAKLMTIAASPLLLVLIVVPEWIMGLFGAEFRAGAMALTIMAVGQFINVATGSVGYLLAMTGREKLLRNAVAAAAGLNLLLLYVLVPTWGLVGTALASATALVVLNVLTALSVWRELGIVTLPVPGRSPRGRG